jgi:hypothetical protein
MISQAHYDRVQGHPRSTRVASQLLLIATKYGSGPTAQRRVRCSNDHQPDHRERRPNSFWPSVNTTV